MPNKVQLLEGPSTETTVNASWNMPLGVISGYRIECEDGTAVPDSIDSIVDDNFSALCENVSDPGGNYTMTVISISSGKENTESIVLTACKSSFLSNYTQS